MTAMKTPDPTPEYRNEAPSQQERSRLLRIYSEEFERATSTPAYVSDHEPVRKAAEGGIFEAIGDEDLRRLFSRAIRHLRSKSYAVTARSVLNQAHQQLMQAKAPVDLEGDEIGLKRHFPRYLPLEWAMHLNDVTGSGGSIHELLAVAMETWTDRTGFPSNVTTRKEWSPAVCAFFGRSSEELDELLGKETA